MIFEPVLPPWKEKIAISTRVREIVSVPGPIRDLLSEPHDIEEEAADFAADLVDRMDDLAESGTPFHSYPHYSATHLAPVPEGSKVVQDNMHAKALYTIIVTHMVTNPEPPPAEIEERHYVKGPTLWDLLSATTWVTKGMLFQGKVDAVDGRTMGHNERQSFVLRASILGPAGVVSSFDVGVGWMGDERTKTWYSVEGGV